MVLFIVGLSASSHDAEPPNTLSASEFRMFGRNDERGRLLEAKDVTIPLHFSHANNGEFTDEGLVKHVDKIDYPGKPEHVFRRE